MNLNSSFDSEFGKIDLAPFQKRDVDALVSYMCDSPPSFLKQIGFSAEDIPEKNSYRERLLKRFKENPQDEFMLMARMNDQTISAVYLDLRGELPHVHFHIYSESLRGKGLGAPILKNSLKLLMLYHDVDELFIEPKNNNIPMNKLMKKCDFEFIGDSVYESSTTGTLPSKKYKVELQKL